MKKSKDVLEDIVRLLALREIDRIEEMTRAENNQGLRITLFIKGKHIQSLMDDLDDAKHFETQVFNNCTNEEIGGTD